MDEIAMQVTDGGAFNADREYANGLHEGIDLRAVPEGSRPVKLKACGAGVAERVRAKDQGSGYGKYVRVRQDDGLVVWYCHLSDTRVTDGEQVEAGEVLGVAESSGNSMGIHLQLT